MVKLKVKKSSSHRKGENKGFKLLTTTIKGPRTNSSKEKLDRKDRQIMKYEMQTLPKLYLALIGRQKRH